MPDTGKVSHIILLIQIVIDVRNTMRDAHKLVEQTRKMAKPVCKHAEPCQNPQKFIQAPSRPPGLIDLLATTQLSKLNAKGQEAIPTLRAA